MKGNNKNNTTHYKGINSFFSGKTKCILILIPAILLLTGILTISLATSQATALPASNIGSLPLNANTMSTRGISSKSNTSLVGSNLTNPAIMDIRGNITMGEHSPDKEVFTNITSYYQLIESNGTGFIGTGTNDNNSLPLYTSDCIRVPKGNGYASIYDSGLDEVYILLKFNYTDAVIYNPDGSISADLVLADYGAVDGTVNVTALANIEPQVMWLHSLWFNESIVMESWGSWFALENGVVNTTDTHFRIEADGSILFQFLNSSLEVNGTSFIKGPVSISGPLNINGGTMTGTGTINIPDGSIQTFGSMKISKGEISSGSPMIITGESIAISGSVMSVGSVLMSGTFLLTIPMSTTGLMVTAGITGMGGLGAINGIMTVTGNIIMSGLTMISGENNILGSMTVGPAGVSVNGLVGLMGIIRTSNTPAITPETILEINSGSLMGLPVPHISVLVDPVTLLVLGVLGIGTVYVVIRSVYFGIKGRRTLEARIRATGEKLRNSGKRLIEQIRGQARPGGE